MRKSSSLRVKKLVPHSESGNNTWVFRDKIISFPHCVNKPEMPKKTLFFNLFHALMPNWHQGVGCPGKERVQGYPAKFPVNQLIIYFWIGIDYEIQTEKIQMISLKKCFSCFQLLFHLKRFSQVLVFWIQILMSLKQRILRFWIHL